MISMILLFWIGIELAAPDWYFFLIFFKIGLEFISFGSYMSKKSSSRRRNDTPFLYSSINEKNDKG